MPRQVGDSVGGWAHAGTPSAVNDPSAARALRKQRRAVIAWLVGGSLLVATFPVLQNIAHDREQKFTQHAKLVTAHVQKTQEGSVWVGYELGGRRVAELNVESSGAYEPGEVVRVLVDRSDPNDAHLPGDEVDFLGRLPGMVYTFGWMGGAVLFATAIYFGRRTWRTAQLLRTYPWQTLPLRWVSDTGHVGELDGTPVGYSAPKPGNATVEVAGPTLPRDGNRSVMRLPADATLHLVNGPVPTVALPEPPDRSGAQLFTESRIVSTIIDRTKGNERQITTGTGTPIASLARGIEYVAARDTTGSVLIEVFGHKNATVLNGAGDHCGTIHFDRGTEQVKLFADGRQVGAFRPVDSTRDHIVAPDGTELAQITRERHDPWRRPSRDTTTVWVRENLPVALRTLVTATALTARWQPRPQGGGG